MKIYTKSGDRGSTKLIGGKEVDKHNIQVDAYGSIDELNSYIGLIKDFTGIDSPYEVPETPDLIINTQNQTIEESEEILYNFIIEKTSLEWIL